MNLLTEDYKFLVQGKKFDWGTEYSQIGDRDGVHDYYLK